MFGKRILITDQDSRPVVDVIAGYRSQSEIEFGFRQLKDPHQVAFSPMFHWTDNNIAVHTFTCVLALQLAHLLRLTAHRAGHDLSVKALLDGHPRRDRRNRADLPLHRRTTQSPPHDHRNEHRPTSPLRPVQPPPMGPKTYHLGHTDNCPLYLP